MSLTLRYRAPDAPRALRRLKKLAEEKKRLEDRGQRILARVRRTARQDVRLRRG